MIKMDLWERIIIPEGIRVPVIGGLIYKLMSARARNQIKRLPYSSLSLNKENRHEIITCSLTSFPDRIDSVQNTIKSLFHQSLKPDRIILWLAESEFQGKELPNSIKELQKQGLEVRFCENYLGYKRYYKLLDEQRDNELIVLFDDDIIFPYYLLERLYCKWQQHPECVVCERGQVLTFKGKDVLNPGRWSSISGVGVKSPSYRILPSPGGGSLIPPHALYTDTNHPEKFCKYALKTGDIWLMFMAAENDTKVIRTHQYHRTFILSEKEQSVQLGREAIYLGRYIQSFNDLSKVYPHAYNNMLSEIEEFNH